MARLLQDRDSSALHLNLARRHQRLARRRRQPAFAAAIEPAIVALAAKMAVTEESGASRAGNDGSPEAPPGARRSPATRRSRRRPHFFCSLT